MDQFSFFHCLKRDQHYFFSKNVHFFFIYMTILITSYFLGQRHYNTNLDPLEELPAIYCDLSTISLWCWFWSVGWIFCILIVWFCKVLGCQLTFLSTVYGYFVIPNDRGLWTYWCNLSGRRQCDVYGVLIQATWRCIEKRLTLCCLMPEKYICGAKLIA